MNLYFADVHVHTAADLDALAALVRKGGYSCVGKSHSYNGVQVIRDAAALHFGRSMLARIDYDDATKTVAIGPSVTIKALKEFLLEKGRRLINSGNYMEQTVIGALMTGTHGYGARAVMADSLLALSFMDASGEIVTLRKGEPGFAHVAVSFGAIAPVVSATLETAPLQAFRSDLWICRLSQKHFRAEGSEAVSYAVLPYSPPEDPTVMLHTLRTAEAGTAVQARTPRPPLLSRRRLAEFIIRRFQAFDRLLPAFRRPLQRWVASLGLDIHQTRMTDPRDLDYLYDPVPGLESSRSPSLLKGFFSTTHTAYNLAFFVPTADAPAVIRFIMNEAEAFRPLGFYLKSLIGVRELRGRSELAFAGNARGAVSAIDLFADVRDYAWLERIQRDVVAYFPDVRPHWGKSAIVDEFRRSLPAGDRAKLRALHLRHYPKGSLVVCEAVRRLFSLGAPDPATSIARAREATARADLSSGIAEFASAVAALGQSGQASGP